MASISRSRFALSSSHVRRCSKCFTQVAGHACWNAARAASHCAESGFLWAHAKYSSRAAQQRSRAPLSINCFKNALQRQGATRPGSGLSGHCCRRGSMRRAAGATARRKRKATHENQHSEACHRKRIRRTRPIHEESIHHFLALTHTQHTHTLSLSPCSPLILALRAHHLCLNRRLVQARLWESSQVGVERHDEPIGGMRNRRSNKPTRTS